MLKEIVLLLFWSAKGLEAGGFDTDLLLELTECM